MTTDKIKTLPACKTCGGTSLYTGYPSGTQYCSSCGNEAMKEPPRNVTPSPDDDDPRKTARKREDAKRKAAGLPLKDTGQTINSLGMGQMIGSEPPTPRPAQPQKKKKRHA